MSDAVTSVGAIRAGDTITCIDHFGGVILKVPAAAARKEGVGGLSFLSEDMHNSILGTCEASDEAHNAGVEADRFGPDGTLLNPVPGIEYDEEAE